MDLQPLLLLREYYTIKSGVWEPLLDLQVTRINSSETVVLCVPPIVAKPVPRQTKGCELSDLFGLLGESYNLDILHLLMEDRKPRRFIEIQRALKMSPNTLSLRLTRLADAGLLKRTAYNEIPPRVDYELTPKAIAMQTAFESLEGWSRRFTLAPEPASQ